MNEDKNGGWKKRIKPLPVSEPKIQLTQVEIVSARIPFGQMIVIIFKGFFALILAMLLASFVVFFITTALGLSLSSFF